MFFTYKSWSDFSTIFQKKHEFQKVMTFLIKKWPLFKNVTFSIFENYTFTKKCKNIFGTWYFLKINLSTYRRISFLLSKIHIFQRRLRPSQVRESNVAFIVSTLFSIESCVFNRMCKSEITYDENNFCVSVYSTQGLLIKCH